MASATGILMAGEPDVSFWPMSRLRKPAFLLNVTDQESVLRRAFAVIERVSSADRRFIVSPEAYAPIVETELEKSKHKVITEPANRGSFGSLGLAMSHASNRSDDVIVAIPPNLWISDVDEYSTALSQAISLATEKPLFVTLATKPSYPEQDYHYLRVMEKALPGASKKSQSTRALAATGLVSRPQRQHATGLLESGEYMWSSGILVFKASLWWRFVKRHHPAAYKSFESLRLASDTTFYKRVLQAEYAQLQSSDIWNSIFMTATDGKKSMAIVPVKECWSLLTGWRSLFRAIPDDGNGNVSAGAVVMEGCSECLLSSEGPLVVTSGLQNMVVVATPDVVLVCNKDDQDGVRAALGRLRANGMQRYL